MKIYTEITEGDIVVHRNEDTCGIVCNVTNTSLTRIIDCVWEKGAQHKHKGCTWGAGELFTLLEQGTWLEVDLDTPELQLKLQSYRNE